MPQRSSRGHTHFVRRWAGTSGLREDPTVAPAHRMLPVPENRTSSASALAATLGFVVGVVAEKLLA